MGAQTPSRRYDVINDHTLTANGPPRGLDLDNLRISAGELPFFRAVAAFEPEIGMAMFVQLLGGETEMAWPFRISHRGGRGQDFDRSVSVR